MATARSSHDEGGDVIYRMTITVKGRKIRRKDGKPFRIVLRKKN
ncbi:hypothetical protein [Laribacter hongkongensis]|nr:hypothetical protein [Laribacter hongkongensis]